MWGSLYLSTVDGAKCAVDNFRGIFIKGLISVDAILHMAPDPVPIITISHKNSPASMNVIICFGCYINPVTRVAYRIFYIIMYATAMCLYA